jgi:hypothetical protein
LAAIELGCLSRRAFVGELALERRAVFACALFGRVVARQRANRREVHVRADRLNR